MGIRKYKKEKKVGLQITLKKLEYLITSFLADHETDMKSDYRPEDEQWRKILAKAISLYIIDKHMGEKSLK